MAAKTDPGDALPAEIYVVLLAEDEPLIRFDIADELRRLGFHVIQAGTADEAIEVVKSAPRIDLVVTDVHMPGDRDGLDVAQTVRQKRPSLKIVVMSGRHVPQDSHEDLIDFFVSKQTSSDWLAKTIKDLMDADMPKRGS